MKLAVLGAGAWGTAIAVVLAPRHEVRLWARDAAFAADLAASRHNERYLRGVILPAAIRVGGDLAAALAGADLAVVATPTNALRGTVRAMRHAGWRGPIVWLCKGFETDSGKLPHEIVADEAGAGGPCGVLSGPSFAREVALGLPAAVTLASVDPDFAGATARALHGATLRVYSSADVVGVGVAGAVKNVMAIAAGISDGLHLGFNARAALITRGLAEITRLGVRLGGHAETFMGLAGAGDLILTCTGDLSRNRQVGLRLAGGERLDAILSALGHVAEGVHTARAVDATARRLGVDMPITREVCRVLFENIAPTEAVRELLEREPKPEYR